MSDAVWGAGDDLPASYVLAKDGLPARKQGPWAQQKLRFLQEYLPPAVGATKRKAGETYYLDLYAGPGRNAFVEGAETRDFPGSPLIALAAEFPFREGRRGFGYFDFCNFSQFDFQLLHARVEAALQRGESRANRDQIREHRGDSNELLRTILTGIPTYAYVLAFADIEGPRDLSFGTLQALREKHSSVDLYVLYPSGIGLDRILAWNPRTRARYAPTLTRYFGTDEWKKVVDSRRTGSQSKHMRGELIDLYLDQLRSLWKHAEVVVRVKKANRGLYHMIFATDHPAAISISKSAKRRSSQLGLLDELG